MVPDGCMSMTLIMIWMCVQQGGGGGCVCPALILRQFCLPTDMCPPPLPNVPPRPLPVAGLAIPLQSVFHCLQESGCLGKVPPATAVPTQQAGVSLTAIKALADGAVGDYDLATLLFALQSLCTGSEGEQRRLADLLTPSHTGSPLTFVSHTQMVEGPEGWQEEQTDPCRQPLVLTLNAVLQYYHRPAEPGQVLSESSQEDLRRRYIWLDVFAVRHHPQLRRGRADLELLDNAVRQAGQRDGTLLVLDPIGSCTVPAVVPLGGVAHRQGCGVPCPPHTLPPGAARSVSAAGMGESSRCSQCCDNAPGGPGTDPANAAAVLQPRHPSGTDF